MNFNSKELDSSMPKNAATSITSSIFVNFFDHVMIVEDLFLSIMCSSCLFLEDPVMHFMENVGKPQVNLWNAELDHRHWIFHCTEMNYWFMIDVLPFPQSFTFYLQKRLLLYSINIKNRTMFMLNVNTCMQWYYGYCECNIRLIYKNKFLFGQWQSGCRLL